MKRKSVKLLGCMRKTVAIIAFGIMLSFGIMLFLLTADHSNAIYFDMESQSIIRCNGTIRHLYIISKDHKDDWHFSILPEKESNRIFCLKELNKNYSIEATNAFTNLQNFKLRPETEYEITNHSDGDRPDGKLIIRTDKNSSVIYADKTSCK